MMRRCGLALGPAVSAMAASAAPTITFVRCAPGGCTCAPVGMSAEELARRAGIGVPVSEGNIALVLKDGILSWSDRLPQQLDLEMGGDGICMPDKLLFFEGSATGVPSHGAPAPGEAQPPATGQTATTEADTSLRCAMTPRDGVWQPVLVEQNFDGCPAAMAEMIRPLLAPSLARREVAWGGRFSPEALSIGDSGIEWRQIGPCNHTGSFPDHGTANLPVDIRYQTNLATPRIAVVNVTARVGIKTGDASTAALLAASGLQSCEARMRFEFRREGQ